MVQLCAELTARLASLGLTEYEDVLVKNGFDTWEAVLDISETDFEALNFKLGHRRKLQREIATYRDYAPNQRLPQDASPQLYSSSSSPGNASGARNDNRGVKKVGEEDRPAKRRYRRHPRPDPNAPHKPKTGYVLFSDHLRSNPEISSLPFVDIAKRVGQMWQAAGKDGRKQWEDRAAAAMVVYRSSLNDYKKTEEHSKYQEYLENFQRQHKDKEVAEELPKEDTISTGPELTDGFDGFSGTGSRKSSQESGITDPSTQVCRTPPNSFDERQNCEFALFQAMRELALLTDSAPPGIEYFDESHPPPEASVTQTLTAFFSGTGGLFFIYLHSDIMTILNHVYNSNGGKVDRFAFMDMLAMTAVGSYYDSYALDHRLRECCFYSCIRLLRNSNETNYLRSMRLFLCLSLYCTLDQPHRARRLISAALQIGRTKLIREGNISGNAQSQDEAYWRKIFRTVVFMECWHSYTLGYQSDIFEDDIKYACFWTDSSHSIEASIQDQVSKIGFLAAEMSRNVRALPDRDMMNLRNHTERLDAWYRELPQMMHLSTLNSPHNTIFSPIQRRSILLMHMFFLSVVALLHRKLLVAIADSRESGTWDFDPSHSEANRYQEYCIIAAQQAARIASLLQFEGNIPKHNWVAM